MVERGSRIHFVSFAGSRHRAEVNFTSIEPQVSYTLENGRSMQTSPTITYDWTAEAWTLPLGADVGKTFTIGAQPVSLSVGGYGLVKRPNGDPSSIVRVQLTWIFPSGQQ